MSYYMPEMDCSAVTSLLQHLSNDELKQLLNDDSHQRVDEMAKDVPQLKSLETERDVLIANNKSLAEFNLSREPIYRNARQKLMDGHSAASAVKDEVDAKRERLRELGRQTSLDTTLALMQTAAAEAEEESEGVANAFLEEREMSLDAFLKEFIDRRKLSHLRRIKTEKMMEHVRAAQANNHMASNHSASMSPFGPMRPAPPPPMPSAALPFASSAQAIQANYAPYPVFPSQMMPQMPQTNYPFNRPGFNR